MRLPVLFYRFCIDPLLRSVRRVIRRQIREHASVIDIASGTGALLFSLAGRCSRLVGVDTDPGMINHGKGRRLQRNSENLEFFREDAADLSRFHDKEFDYAVLSMAVHQFDPGILDRVMEEAVRISREIIFADYTVPRPGNLYGRISYMVERLAGKEHFSHYLSFTASGGLPGLVRKHRFSVISEQETAGKVFSVFRVGR